MQLDLNAALWQGLLGALPFFLKICWPAILLFIAVEGFKLYRAINERKRLAASGIADIDSMDGKTFEKRLEVLFENLGYRVERTPYVGDWGADLVVQRDGVKTVVQAKRYNKRVGVRAVQEAVAAKPKYNCSAAMVVTNSRFTNQARELARVNNVELWDRERLVSALMQSGRAKEKTNTLPSAPAAVPITMQPTPMPIGAPVTRTATETAASGEICAECGRGLTPKVAQYCRDNSNRFGGRLLCFDHQRSARSVASR